MPIVNIMVLNKKKDAKDSGPCQLMFADPEDCGKIALEDVHIYRVFNVIDHFLGTQERIPSFRQGKDDIFSKLMEATSVGSSVGLCTEDKTVQLTWSQAVDVIKSVGQTLNKIIIPTEDNEEVTSPTKKGGEHQRNLGKPGPKTPPLLHFTVHVGNCSQMMMS